MASTVIFFLARALTCDARYRLHNAAIDNKVKLLEITRELTDEFTASIYYKKNGEWSNRHYKIDIAIGTDTDLDKLITVLGRFEKKCLSEQFSLKYYREYVEPHQKILGEGNYTTSYKEAVEKYKSQQLTGTLTIRVR